MDPIKPAEEQENLISEPHSIAVVPASNPAQPTERKSSNLSIKLFSFMAFFLAMITLGGVFYIAQQIKSQQSQSTQVILTLQQRVSALDRLLEKQQETVLKSQQALNKLQEQQAQQINNQWLLEINDRVQKAVFYLNVENNIPLARQILTAVDQRLSTDQSAFWLPLRQALHQDITALNTMPILDTTGLVSQLGALTQQITQLTTLPLRILQTNSVPVEVPPVPHNSNMVWYQKYIQYFKNLFITIGQVVSKMVIISKDDHLTPTLLTNTQRWYVINNIQSQLGLAQWAVIHQQKTIYEQSLAQVAVWLSHYFSMDDPLVKEILQSVKQLHNIVWNPPKSPVLFSTLVLEKMMLNTP